MDLPNNINPQDLTFEKVWLLFQETDKKFQETDKKLEKLGAKIDRLAEIYGGFMNNVARTAEGFYYYSLKNILDANEAITINGFYFYRVLRNITIGSKKKRKEFDIVLINSQQKVLAIFEIKMNFRLVDLEKFTSSVMDYVRSDKEFFDYNVILGIGAFDYDQEVISEAKKQGLVILRPNFNDNTVIFENTEPDKLKIFKS